MRGCLVSDGSVLRSEEERANGGLRAHERAALDDADELASYTSFGGPSDAPVSATSRLRVDGLHCAACAGLIEQALLRVPGVESADVNGAARRASVTWDPRQSKASDLVEAVRAAGYRAYPDTAAREQPAELDTGESRRMLWRLFVAGFCMMQVMMYATATYVAAPGDIDAQTLRLLNWAGWLLSLPVVLFAAVPFYRGAWQALRQGRVGMDLPVVLGILVTFLASTAATFDAAGVQPREVYFDSLTMFVTFLLGGRALEQRARARAARALDSALNRLPAAVQRRGADGAWAWVSPTRLQPGDCIRIAAGQAFAADGVVIEGRTDVDEALLTGESRPLPREAGDEVLAGSINLAGPVSVRVTRLGGQTRFDGIVQLVSQAMTRRPSAVRLADRIAGPFLWCVLLLAAAAAAGWSLVDPSRAVWVAVAVLVVTCPCALSLAAPSAMVAAAGALARRGVLLRRLDALEALAGVELFVFDKTGTLTDACPQVVDIQAAAGLDKAALLRAAAGLAAHSAHPLSQALAAAGEAGGAPGWTQLREEPGSGLEGTDPQGRRWRLGSADWTGVDVEAAHGMGFDVERVRVWLAPAQLSEGFAGFELDEVLRPGSATAVARLRAQGAEVMLLSGDQPQRVLHLARRLGISRVEAGATPEAKLAVVQREQRAGRRVAVIGDGINDAPVLAQADVSFAMAHGAALAQARADVLLLGSRPLDVVESLVLARRTLRIVRQNLWWAAAYNLVSLPLALGGWLPPWLAGLGMAASSLLVVGNALRVARAAADAQPDAAAARAALAA